MSRYLFINAHSSKNIGDFAIVSEMIKNIFQNDKKALIYVMSNYLEEDIAAYSTLGVEIVEPLFLTSPSRSKIRKLVLWISNLAQIFIYRNSELSKFFRGFDFVQSVGGGYLYSSNQGPLGMGFVAALLHIYVFSHISRKLIIFPVSVGPLNRIDAIFVKKVLKKGFLLLSRDTNTDLTLSRLEVNFVKSIDFVFQSAKYDVNNSKTKEAAKKIKIGITVIDFRFARRNSTETDLQIYLEKLHLAILGLVEDFEEFEVYVFLHVDVGGKDSDLNVSLKFKEYFGNNAEIVFLAKNMSFGQISDKYGEMDIFIASRMHSAIFAINAGVKCVALSYQPKTIGTFERLDISENCIDIYRFSTPELIEKLKNAVMPDKDKIMDYNLSTLRILEEFYVSN